MVVGVAVLEAVFAHTAAEPAVADRYRVQGFGTGFAAGPAVPQVGVRIDAHPAATGLAASACDATAPAVAVVARGVHADGAALHLALWTVTGTAGAANTILPRRAEIATASAVMRVSGCVEAHPAAAGCAGAADVAASTAVVMIRGRVEACPIAPYLARLRAVFASADAPDAARAHSASVVTLAAVSGIGKRIDADAIALRWET